MWVPILKGMATPREMQDGTYDLDDLADMLEAIAFQQCIEQRGIARSKENGQSY